MGGRTLRRLALGGLVAAALWAAGDGRAEGAAARGWPMRKEGGDLVVETPNYAIRTDLSEAVAQTLASHQEALFTELYRRMASINRPSEFKRLDILVVGAQKEYMSRVGSIAAGSKGIFMPYKNMLAVWGGEDELDEILETLRHEGTHQFVAQFIGPDCPIWINEGLAVFYQHARFEGGRLLVGDVPAQRLRFLKRAIGEDRALSTTRMLTMSNETWLANVYGGGIQGHLQYCQAWSMVHFLAYGGGGKYRGPLEQYLYWIARGRHSTDAWDKSFGPDLRGFDARWREYVEQLKPTAGDCRKNLQLLGYILARYHVKTDLCKDMETFRQSLLEGKFGKWTIGLSDGMTLESDAQDELKALLRCPEAKSRGTAPSYEMVPGKPGEPPVLRCRHHKGFVYETVYEQAGKGVTRVSVASRPVIAMPPAKTPALVPAAPAKTPAPGAPAKVPEPGTPAKTPAPAAR